MTRNTDSSAVETLIKEVGKILAPTLEASRLQRELKIDSLEATCAALEQAGYEIYRADLPKAVNGFAGMIDGQPYIVTNRCDCFDQQRYTVAHELGHHVLHLNPSPAIAELGLANENEEDREFQADQFAIAWFMQSANPEQRKRFLKDNPRAKSVLAESMMAVVLTVLPFVVLYVCSRLFSKNAPA